MFPSSYSHVFSIHPEPNGPQHIRPGDQVRCGENLYPHFEVVAVDRDTVWLRNVTDGSDHLAPLSRCRKLPPDANLKHAAE